MLLALLIATACVRSGTSSSSASPTPRSPTPPAPGAVVWGDCSNGFQCGFVTVPLDYANPARDTIDIALIRKPATDPTHRIGSVLMNPGGPGASGLDFLRGEASAMTRLNQKFDLVGFDPRGVGRSAPVRCLTPPDLDTYNAIDSVLDDPQEKQAAIQELKDFAAGCEQRSGKVLPFVDTVSAARDIDLIRIALGDDKLTYFGFSYATFLGQTYASLFPTHIRAMALDAVVDPSLSYNDLLLTQVSSFQKVLDAFLADCKAHVSTTCAYGRSGDPGQKLLALSQRLDKQPMQVGNRVLTRTLALYGIGYAMYNQGNWPSLDLALNLVDQGNGAILLYMADQYLGRQDDGTYNNEGEAYWAVSCLDRPVPKDVAAYDQLGPAFQAASPLFGPFDQYSNLQCAYWPAKPTGHGGPLTADGAPPILIVGGTNDPATPYAWSIAVSQRLAGSVLLTRRGNGHGSYNVSLCSRAAEDAYLINLTLPAPGTVCTT